MFFILTDEQRRNAAIAFIKGTNIRGPVQSVEVKEYKKNRSSSQNRLLWSWYNVFARETGYTPDELHEQFKVRLLGVEEKTVEGELLRQPKSTAKLNVQEFGEYLNKIEMVAMEMGLTLPYPDDFKYAMGQEFAAQV